MPFITFVIIVAVIVGLVLLCKQIVRSPVQPTANKLKSYPRTLFTLEIGDIVQYLDTDWIVEGKLIYDDNGYTWLEYLLQDSDRRRWLSVVEEDTVELELSETITQLEISPPPPAQLIFANESYQQVESGTAHMIRVGSTLNRQGEQCSYFDYKGPDEKVLSIELWGNDVEVTVGQRVQPSLLTFLPGDGQRIYGA